jgi:hypothetical protein
VIYYCRVVAKDELDNMLANHQLGRRVPLLFLANKMDLPSALTPVELAQVRPAASCVICHGVAQLMAAALYWYFLVHHGVEVIGVPGTAVDVRKNAGLPAACRMSSTSSA